MKKNLLAILMVLTSTSVLADGGASAKDICKQDNDKRVFIESVHIDEINATRGGSINFKTAGKNGTWYYAEGNSDVITSIQYDYLKTAYMGGIAADICVTRYGKLLALELNPESL